VSLGGGKSGISGCVRRATREFKFVDPLVNNPSQSLGNDVKRPLLKFTALQW
jgi:hypothetical protein